MAERWVRKIAITSAFLRALASAVLRSQKRYFHRLQAGKHGLETTAFVLRLDRQRRISKYPSNSSVFHDGQWNVRETREASTEVRHTPLVRLVNHSVMLMMIVFRHIDTHRVQLQNRLDVHLSQLQPANPYTEHVQSAGLGGVCLPSLQREAGSEGSAFDAVRCVDDVPFRAWPPGTHL